jgi:hypothetical protein
MYQRMLHALLILALDEGECQIHALATLIPRKESLTPNGEEARWTQELIWMQMGKKKSLFLPRIKSQFTGHPASSLVIILTQLS